MHIALAMLPRLGRALFFAPTVVEPSATSSATPAFSAMAHAVASATPQGISCPLGQAPRGTVCVAIPYIELLDASGKDVPRNPTGMRVSLADFDWTATGNAAVGKYSGPTA